MPTLLGSPHSPRWEGKPPGMQPRDLPIWHRFRKKHQAEILRVWYNVRVGGGGMPQEDVEADILLMWLSLTMLRIDAVVETEKEVWIIEVRPNAGRSAFGAVMIYTQLWAADPIIPKPAKAVVVTDTITPQMQAIYDLNGVTVKVA